MIRQPEKAKLESYLMEVITSQMFNREQLPLPVWIYLVKLRAGYKCQGGNHTELENELGLDSHHILPLVLGGMNTLNNGQCLCDICHGLIHLHMPMYSQTAREIGLIPFVCQQCGHKWEPKKWHPKSCPKCSSLHWNGRKSIHTVVWRQWNESLSNWAQRCLSKHE